MDCIYPGTFNLAKVKWGAKFDYEYIENYKILQQAFDKNGVKRHIEVSILNHSNNNSQNLPTFLWKVEVYLKTNLGDIFK